VCVGLIRGLCGVFFGLGVLVGVCGFVWWWANPVVIGAMMALIAVMMRSSLHETEEISEARTPQQARKLIPAVFKSIPAV